MEVLGLNGGSKRDDAVERVESSWRSARRLRWSSRAPRYLMSGVLIVLLALGVRALVLPVKASVPAASTPSLADAPSEDFALQFARAYLSYESEAPERRSEALAPFVGQVVSSDAGFTAAQGSRHVIWADVASDQAALAGGRVITVAAKVTGQALPLYLAVTVRHRAGMPLQLGGYPSLVGAPAVDAGAPAVSGSVVGDSGVKTVVERVLRNYLASAAPNLKADLTSNAAVTLPTTRLHVQSVTQTLWVAGAGSGAVLATVDASDEADNTYTLTYELGIVYRERPYVDFIEVVPTAT